MLYSRVKKKTRSPGHVSDSKPVAAGFIYFLFTHFQTPQLPPTFNPPASQAPKTIPSNREFGGLLLIILSYQTKRDQIYAK